MKTTHRHTLRATVVRCSLILSAIHFAHFFGDAAILADEPAATASSVVSPFDVGDKAQLFIDRLLVHETSGVSFSQHSAYTYDKNPVVVPDKPWEGWRLEIYGSVIYDEDEKLFKMWYIGESPEEFPDYAILYATSKDGLSWEKPLVGTVKSKSGAQTNAVADGYLLASVIKDKSDPNPARRYKMICWRQKKPYAAQSMTSPDGLNWKEVSDKPICRSSDVITGYYDKSRKSYVAFPKLNSMVRGQERRCFGVTMSSDFLNWSEPQLCLVPDARDDAGSLARLERVRNVLDRPDDPKLMRTEFYGMGVYPHESCTIAFPWVFTINNNARYGNQEGPAEIQLAVSRDLVNWERPFRTPVIPINKRGSWDESYQATSAQAIRVGNTVRLYYCGANYTHGTPVLYRTKFEDGSDTGRKTKYTSGIGVAYWLLDRFVSADAGTDEGTLTTIPIRYSGKRLELNYETKPSGFVNQAGNPVYAGHVTVEILDAAGNPIPGFESSNKLMKQDFQGQVKFNDNADLSSLAGKPVVLRFHLENAKLYSFAFRQ